MTYDHSLFQLAFRRYQSHGGVRKTARAVDVSPSTISRWIKRFNWTASTKRCIKHTRRRPSPTLTPDVCKIVLEFFKDPAFQCTTARLCAHHILSTHGIRLSLSSIRRCIHMVGLSRKRLSGKILGISNPQLIEEYKNMHSDLVTDGTIVLSVDECYFSERVVPLYGYSEVGTRCVHRIGKGGWKHRSLVLGISNDGTQFAQVYEGGVNREMFKSYIRDLPYPPGTVLILDNCNTHKKIDDAIAERGFRVLYLPPYSPQFQPVELAFSKVKGLFRTSFPWPDGVVDSVHAAVDQLTAENSKGYFKHAADQLAKVPCVCSRLLFSAETAG